MVYSLGASPTAHYPCRRQSLWLSLFCWRTVIRNPVCGEAIEFSYLGIHFVGISDETQVNINSIEKFSHKPLHLRKTQFTKVHHMLKRYHRCQKKKLIFFFSISQKMYFTDLLSKTWATITDQRTNICLNSGRRGDSLGWANGEE